jgi:2-polyprenyl-6-methoxyphenol hydroxylase-like FAD-dependent oxidoreductase
MSHSAPAPIAIVGGGPCGLTLARLFERAGIDYVVFERDASATPGQHSQGGTLDLHPGTGLTALEVAGLMPEFEKVARREADVFTLMDAHGGNYYRAGAEVDETEEAKEKVKEMMENRPEIDRYQLRGLLLDSVPAQRIRWGKALKSVERKEGHEGTAAAGWVLRFADGSEEHGFRLVIGADGAWSKVRPLVCTSFFFFFPFFSCLHVFFSVSDIRICFILLSPHSRGEPWLIFVLL